MVLDPRGGIKEKALSRLKTGLLQWFDFGERDLRFSKNYISSTYACEDIKIPTQPEYVSESYVALRPEARGHRILHRLNH